MKKLFYIFFLASFYFIALPCFAWGAACTSTATSIAQLNTNIAAASAGDEICLQDGTYTDNVTIVIGATKDGSDGTEFVLRPENIGGVTLSGLVTTWVITAAGDFWIIKDFKFLNLSEDSDDSTYGIKVDGNDVRITNNYIEGFGENLDDWSSGTTYADNDSVRYNGVNYLSLQGSNTNHTPSDLGAWWEVDALRDWFIYTIGDRTEIDHNTFDENECVHVTIKQQSQDSHVHHNYFKNGSDGGANGHETIFIGDSGTSSATVEYNVFEDIGGPAEDETISNKNSGNTYRYNVFRADDGAIYNGITLRTGNSATINGNFFIDVSQHSILVHGSSHTIFNNYFENPDFSAIYMTNGESDASCGYYTVVDAFIANNTIVNPTYRGIDIGSVTACPTAPTDTTIINNHLYSDNGTGSTKLIRNTEYAGSLTLTTNGYWIPSGSASAWDNNGGGANPGGTDYASLDPDYTTSYDIKHLQVTSTDLIDSGTAIATGSGHPVTITDDIDGDTPRGTPPDIGADEYKVDTPSITMANIIAEAGYNITLYPPAGKSKFIRGTIR